MTAGRSHRFYLNTNGVLRSPCIALTSKLEKTSDRGLVAFRPTECTDRRRRFLHVHYIYYEGTKGYSLGGGGNIWHRLNGIFNPRHVSVATRKHRRKESHTRAWIELTDREFRYAVPPCFSYVYQIFKRCMRMYFD